MVISCPGRLDPGYRSVILYAERIMVLPMTAMAIRPIFEPPSESGTRMIFVDPRVTGPHSQVLSRPVAPSICITAARLSHCHGRCFVRVRIDFES